MKINRDIQNQSSETETDESSSQED